MKKNLLPRVLGATAIALAIGVVPAPVAALIIGFEAEVHTGNADFAIRNTSDPGVLISQVILTLGDGMQFDTTVGGAAFDPVPTALSDNTGTSIGHFTNTILPPSPWVTQAGTVVGFVGTLGAAVVDGARAATFTFNDFARGEAWGMNVDYDKLTADTDPAGADMNNARIAVTFTDAAGNFLYTLTYNYDNNYSGNKRSFPTDTGNLQGPWVNLLPEPGPLALCAVGLLGLAGITRVRRRKDVVEAGQSDQEGSTAYRPA